MSEPAPPSSDWQVAATVAGLALLVIAVAVLFEPVRFLWDFFLGSGWSFG